MVPGSNTPASTLSQIENDQIYCGLDSCLTLEIHEALERIFGDREMGIYNFERAVQAPYLEIMLRGFLVDHMERHLAAADLRKSIAELRDLLDRFARAIWDKPLNPNSPQQLKAFLYGAMHLPEVWLNFKGERKVSTNREALEKCSAYIHALPVVNTILAIRDLKKQLNTFETEIDSDGRFRASYNVAGTESGRPSSSENAYGTGGNAQNIAAPLRYVFTADPGWKLCVIDLEQVEARDVGFFCGCLFDDWSFLDACEGGDLHTSNAMLIWPERPWPKGDKKACRELAEQPFYRDFSFRDMAKRGSHLSNYSGTAFTASRALKVPLPIMEEFQARYCRGRPASGLTPAISPAYPCIPRWWGWTAEQLQTKQFITTPFGRKRHFFGRPDDDATLREAIAFLPQSTTADRMNLGLWRVWKYMPEVQLLAQTYDSITFQFRDVPGEEERVIRKALKLIEVELRAPNGRKYVVPGEAKTGWNWGPEVTEDDIARARKSDAKVPRLNPEGLRKWKLGKTDPRRRREGLARMFA